MSAEYHTLSSASRQPCYSRSHGSGCRFSYRAHSDRSSSHRQVAQLVRSLALEPVLDVGAAQGYLGQGLQQDGIVIDAIEPNQTCADHARAFYRTVYSQPVELANLPRETYRVVVCADVLEHIVEPATVLAKLRISATPDALFIVSVPNVAHIAARLIILLGYFPLMDQGIFDRTHLHFYTLRTARNLLTEAGLHVIWTRPTPVPLEVIWPQRAHRLGLNLAMALQRGLLLLAPRLFGFQWILVATSKQPL